MCSGVSFKVLQISEMKSVLVCEMLECPVRARSRPAGLRPSVFCCGAWDARMVHLHRPPAMSRFRLLSQCGLRRGISGSWVPPTTATEDPPTWAIGAATEKVSRHRHLTSSRHVVPQAKQLAQNENLANWHLFASADAYPKVKSNSLSFQRNGNRKFEDKPRLTLLLYHLRQVSSLTTMKSPLRSTYPTFRKKPI